MNKQQLANKIWKSANQMRSKIEANEYKDFILGFMFYKYLSEKELAFFHSQGMTEADIQGMDETDTDFVEYTKDKSAISSPTIICFLHGSIRNQILTCQMSATDYLHFRV